MKEELISHETSKLANKKGFNITTKYSWYIPDNSAPILEKHKSDGGYYLSAPRQGLLTKWLREIHNIQVYCLSHTLRNGIYGDYVVYVNNMALNDARDGEFQIYEEALEFGLFSTLKLIK